MIGHGWCVTSNGVDQVLVERGRWPGFRRGPATQVKVAGQYAYVAAGGLQIIDISHPAEMKLAGGILSVADINHVAVVTDKTALRVIDITNPVRNRPSPRVLLPSVRRAGSPGSVGPDPWV